MANNLAVCADENCFRSRRRDVVKGREQAVSALLDALKRLDASGLIGC